jgi:hypothetical protein
MESDLLKHLQICGRRYEKIDLRGCHKLTGTVLFRESEKRALSEGLIKSDAVFECIDFIILLMHAHSHYRAQSRHQCSSDDWSADKS